MIEFEGVTKRFGSTTAVDRLTLTVGRGELFAFLGPNGAGKTTTIKMTVGLLRPSAGAVRVCGHDVQREPIAARRRIGYVPDRPYLYPTLSGREFLEFSGGMYGLRPREVHRRAEPLLARVDMTEHADRRIGSYSHGMRQKLAFVASLVHEPEVLVIDEPMVGLDPRSARVVKDLLRQQADAGRTVFLSTHVLDVAEELADRAGILHHGRLVAVGGIADLRQATGDTGARLEQVFLQLTEEQACGPAPVLELPVAG